MFTYYFSVPNCTDDLTYESESLQDAFWELEDYFDNVEAHPDWDETIRWTKYSEKEGEITELSSGDFEYGEKYTYFNKHIEA